MLICCRMFADVQCTHVIAHFSPCSCGAVCVPNASSHSVRMAHGAWRTAHVSYGPKLQLLTPKPLWTGGGGQLPAAECRRLVPGLQSVCSGRHAALANTIHAVMLSRVWT